MTVRTLFFAIYRDLAGVESLDLQLRPGAVVADLVAALRDRGGRWAELPLVPAVAVNLEYASPGTPLRDGDEVALIPPVSGG